MRPSLKILTVFCHFHAFSYRNQSTSVVCERKQLWELYYNSNDNYSQLPYYTPY